MTGEAVSTDRSRIIAAIRSLIGVERRGVLHALIGLCFAALVQEGVAEAAAEQQKWVFAHYMVCCPRAGANPAVEDFLQEMREARAAGIDGFALNCGEWAANPIYPRNAAKLYEAAARMGPEFKLFFSADLATNLGSDEVVDMVASYAAHPNQLRHDGRPVLSSFGGDGAWARTVRTMILERKGIDIFLVPYFYPRSKRETPIASDVDLLAGDSEHIDGFFYFGAAGTPQALVDSIRLNARKWSSHGKLFMAGVAPYYRGLWRNYRIFEANGFESLVKQWMTVIETGTPWVELVTWNDWGESTYFAPINPDDADVLSLPIWGTLLSHRSFLEVNRYFSEWFKSGKQPGIAKERVYYAYRTHLRGALGAPSPGSPQAGRPAGVSTLNDRIHLLSFLEKPARIIVRVGQASHARWVQAGMQDVSVPMTAGEIEFEVIRDDVTIGRKRSELPISAFDGSGNFNIFTSKLELK